MPASLAAPEVGTIGRLQGLIEMVHDQEERTIGEEVKALDLILEQLRPLINAISTPGEVYYRPQFTVLEETRRACLETLVGGLEITKRFILFDHTLAEEIRTTGNTPSGLSWDDVRYQELSTTEAVRIYGLRPILNGLARGVQEASVRMEHQLAALEDRKVLAKRLQEVLQGV